MHVLRTNRIPGVLTLRSAYIIFLLSLCQLFVYLVPEFFPETSSSLNDYDIIIFIFGFLVNIFFSISFFVWHIRAYKNLEKMHEKIGHDTPTVWISWFIPFVQLFLPLAVMLETLKIYRNVIKEETHSAKSDMIIAIIWWIGFWGMLGVFLASGTYLRYYADILFFTSIPKLISISALIAIVRRVRRREAILYRMQYEEMIIFKEEAGVPASQV